MAFDCTDIKAILSGLVDGEIDIETRHLAERHLSGCASCRGLVNEAEGLDDLIAMDASGLAPRRLPEGFVDSVMSRTVYARLYEQAGWSWTNWLGWVAAAACLGLAASIWFLDRQSVAPMPDNAFAIGPREGGASKPAPIQIAENTGPRSWIYEGDFEPEVMLASNVQHAIDAELDMTLPSRSALERISQRSTITPADSDTLHATAIVLDMLADSDLSNFADVERVREIAAYDELPGRLADLRSRLRPADRAAVMAAESVILRIVNGPMDLTDLRLLHETSSSMNLAAQIGAIGAGGDAATSL